MLVKKFKRDFVIKTALKVILDDLGNISIDIKENNAKVEQAFTTENVCYLIEDNYLEKQVEVKTAKGTISFDLNSIAEQTNVTTSFTADDKLKVDLATVLVSLVEKDIVFNRDEDNVYLKSEYTDSNFVNMCLAYCESEPDLESNSDRDDLTKK